MRSSIILALAASAFAHLNNTDMSAGTCLTTCERHDVVCRADCVGILYPGIVAMDAATDCIIRCGSADMTLTPNMTFNDCRSVCVNTHLIDNNKSPYFAAPPLDLDSATQTGNSNSSDVPDVSANEPNATSAKFKWDRSEFMTFSLDRMAANTSKDSTRPTSNAAPTPDYKLNEVVGALGIAFAAFAML